LDGPDKLSRHRRRPELELAAAGADRESDGKPGPRSSRCEARPGCGPQRPALKARLRQRCSRELANQCSLSATLVARRGGMQAAGRRGGHHGDAVGAVPLSAGCTTAQPLGRMATRTPVLVLLVAVALVSFGMIALKLPARAR